MSNFKSKTMKTTKLLAILFISALCFTACSEDDDHDHDDHGHGEHEEEITQLVYTLTNTDNSADVVTFTFTDEDGDGGQDGTQDVSGNLTANATYEGKLELLNLEEGEDVGAEIAEDDAEDHEIFYITNVAGLQFTTTDVDANSNPLGFDTEVTTGAGGTSVLTISVVHEGKKPNDGTTQDALSGGGTTDIEATFNVTVEHGEHEEEITQLVYKLTNTDNSADVVTFTFTDEDGEGGADGVSVVSGNLTANATYKGKLELLNLEEGEDVGAEIAEDDAEDHEIFYITNVAGLQFTTTDVDANSNPLGFDTDVTAGDAGSGALTISIVHEGKKPNDGTVTDAVSGNGTTDIEVTFDVTVE